MKIYTKTGDLGETGILGGIRVPKDDLVICAIGDVDEVNSHLGLAASQLVGNELEAIIHQIQSDLFIVGSQLANCRSEKSDRVHLTETGIERLESCIDSVDAELPKMSAFILPGGTAEGAHLHVARSVCRRAERSVVNLLNDGDTKSDLSVISIYLNRLSDLIFVLARKINLDSGCPEISWLPAKNGGT